MESCESQSVIFEIYVSGTLTTQLHSSTRVSNLSYLNLRIALV